MKDEEDILESKDFESNDQLLSTEDMPDFSQYTQLQYGYVRALNWALFLVLILGAFLVTAIWIKLSPTLSYCEINN